MIKCDLEKVEMRGFEPILLAELSTCVAGMVEKISSREEVMRACLIGLNHKAFEEDPDRVWKMVSDAIDENRK